MNPAQEVTLPNFDLTYQPWIPARTLDGRSVLLSWRELLAQAHTLSGIDDSNPLITASLIRLTLALLYRALRPTGLTQLRTLLRAGQFDMGVLNAYLDQREHATRFDLFGPTPFFQVGDLEFARDTSVAKLAAERSSGNNKALFDHSLDDQPQTLSFAEAARQLVAHQAFSLCGGVSAGGLINFTDAVSPRPALMFVTGADLFQSLIGNLVIYKDEEGVAEDLAVWERPTLTLTALKAGQKHSLVPGEFARLYTWPSRAIKLFPSEDGVSRMFYASGWQANGTWRDPAVAYEIPKKKDAEQISVKFSLSKGFWRDFGALVPPSGRGLRPSVLGIAEQLEDVLSEKGALRITLLGQITRPGKPVVEAWRTETYPLPLTLLEREVVRVALADATTLSEEVHRAIRNAGHAITQGLADGDIAWKMLENLPLERIYWATLETRFTEFLTRLATEEPLEDVFNWWTTQVLLTVREAFRLTRRALGHGGREIRAVMEGEGQLLRELKKIQLKEKYLALFKGAA
jgi:CRISPR system Cascade subunit CasA